MDGRKRSSLRHQKASAFNNIKLNVFHIHTSHSYSHTHTHTHTNTSLSCLFPKIRFIFKPQVPKQAIEREGKRDGRGKRGEERVGGGWGQT